MTYEELQTLIESISDLSRKEQALIIVDRVDKEKQSIAFKILDNPQDAAKLCQSHNTVMTNTHYSFPKIEQFAHVKRNVEHKAQFVGLDEQGEPIMNRTATLPVVRFEGTVKLHGCLHENTLVTMADGSVEQISKLKKGDNILSYNTECGKFTDSVVDGVFSDVLEKKWIRLHFSDRVIICTEDHKFFTVNGWKEAKDLSSDDVFVVTDSDWKTSPTECREKIEQLIKYETDKKRRVD